MAKNHTPEVIYQVYPASFNDSNGDGHGDLKGITQKLDHIKSLGVDAIWISPFFLTPKGKASDGGYAISNYREIDPKFGSMQDFDELLKKAHEKGLRIYTDFVMCHTSNEHEWFKKSENREPGFEDRYVWSDGKKKENGELILIDGKPIPPNNWLSTFGGSAWNYNEKRKQFYLHHFAESQPALNGNSNAVQDKVIGEMRFWLNKGVDGLRLDALPFANYDPELKDNSWRYDYKAWNAQNFDWSICQPQTIQYVAKIRKMFDEYPGKTAIGEAIAGREGGFNPMPVAKDYVHPETGLHTCYTERLHWKYPSASDLKGKLEYALKEFPNGSLCHMLSNHDFPRIDPGLLPENLPEDLRKSAYKQLMAINLSLPGYVCMYQGDELGLTNARLHDDIPGDKIKDLVDYGRRDGSRTPMPWDSSKSNAGFSTSSDPYLPVPKSHYASAVNEQESERNSILQFTREIIADRKSNPALREGTTNILNAPDPIFAFTRHVDEHTDAHGKKIPAQTVLFMANMGIHTQMINPSSFLDANTIKELNLSADDQIIMSGFSYTRRGLLNHKKTHQLEAAENGHIGTNIFAADMLLADVFHRKEDTGDFIKKHNLRPAQRLSIEQDMHNELLSLPYDKQSTTIGGSTLLTMSTLKKLNPDVNVDYMGMVGDDEHGKMIKKHLQEAKINLLTPNWPEGIKQETGTTHILKNNSHEILATYSGTAAEALNRVLGHEPHLLEKSIKKADIIYLPGSTMEKFGKSFVDEILRLRWENKKELILSLPVHANFGHDDPAVFQRLIKSANIVVGNDVEYCRIFGIDAARPTSGAHMDIVVKGIQKAFKEEILLNNSMPCKSEPVAFITRGDQDALLVTAKAVIKIPIAKIENVNNSLGSGDAATAAFLDAELRGLSHEQSARYAMAMGAEKAQQTSHSPCLDNPLKARTSIFRRNSLREVAKLYDRNQIIPPIGPLPQSAIQRY